MANIIVSEKEIVEEKARQYKAEGYHVYVEPSGSILPDFLHGFRPDLIAQRSDRSVIVEIRSPGKVRRSDYWRDLSEAVQQHPDWHFELIVNAPQDNMAKGRSLSAAEIRQLLEQSEQMAQQNAISASLLLAWSALEATMRQALHNADAQPPDLKPATLVSRLYTEGLVDRTDYDFLLSAMRQRNAVAHGFYQRIVVNNIQRLRSIAQELNTSNQKQSQ